MQTDELTQQLQVVKGTERGKISCTKIVCVIRHKNPYRQGFMAVPPKRQLKNHRSELAVGHKYMNTQTSIAFIASRNIKNPNQTKKPYQPCPTALCFLTETLPYFAATMYFFPY